mgnify:CR=1 FL=1
MFKKVLSIFIVCLLATLTSGCINITDQQKSGFLKNYDSFVDVVDPDYTKVYKAENFSITTIANMDKIKLIPFEMWITPGVDAKFTTEQLDELSMYLNKQLTTKLTANNYQVVDRVGPQTITIRGALSGVKFESPELSPLDFVPFRIVVNAGNYAYLQIADKQDVTTKVSLEIEFLQGLRRQRILAAISTKYVDTTIANSGIDNMKAVQNLLDDWAEKFVSRLLSIREEQANKD